MVKKDKGQGQPTDNSVVAVPPARTRARASGKTPEPAKPARKPAKKAVPKVKETPEPEPTKDLATIPGLWVDEERHELSGRDALFISHYILTHDVVASMQRAGYSFNSHEDRVTVRAIMDGPKFAELIEEYESDMANRVGLTKAKLYQVLWQAIEFCMSTKDMAQLHKFVALAGKWEGLEKRTAADGMKELIYTLNIPNNRDPIDAELVD